MQVGRYQAEREVMRLEYKRLDTGYHYVRDADAHHLFVQWPVGQSAKKEDVSGVPWSISAADLAEQAQRLADSQSDRGTEHG